MSNLKEVIEYGKLLHEKNLVIGAGGNISIREGDGIIIKKRCADMSKCLEKDYEKVSFKEIDAKQEELSTETPFHVACYNAREDIGAVIHVHSPSMVAVSMKTDVLEDISYEFTYVIGEKVPVIEYIQPGSQKLADTIKHEIKRGYCAILMQKHGAVVVGKDLEEAYVRTLALERACITYLLINS